MRQQNWLFLLILSVVLTGGCAFSRGSLGDEIKPGDVASIKKGTSTRGEVVTIMGAPDRIVQANGHEILQYYRYDLKSSSLLLILVNFSRFNIKSDDLYVLVGRDGIVDDIVFGRRTPNLEFQFWPFGE